MREEMAICSMCGTEHPTVNMTCFGDHNLCPDCLRRHTRICDHCGDRIWLSDDRGEDALTLCGHCAENFYTHCSGCGLFAEEDQLHYLGNGEQLCEDCYNHCRQPEAGVRSYCYKPAPIFYGDGSRYFGVELEIDEGGESNYEANLIQQIANRDHDHIYCKHDGSLEDGFEIVTHPMTLDYHRNEMPWEGIVWEALHQGYTSHKAGTCGLHVHVNRDSLGDSEWEQDNTIARILFLVETFWHELLRFSRRTQEQMDRWASRYGRKDDPKDVLHTAKRSGDRYTAVNLTPSRTIEFRLFRGTLKYNTIIATLQMVERLCDVAFSLSDELVKGITWTEFVTGIPKDTMPELVQYLKERRLYVNEPVVTEEEV